MFDFKSILFDKRIYGISLLPSRSRFLSFRDEEEKKREETDLSGIWKGHFFEDYPQDIERYLDPGFDISDQKDVEVPLSLELQGFLPLQYVNTEYPFDGINRSENGEPLTVKNPSMLYFKELEIEDKKDDVFLLDIKGFESGLFVYVNGKEVGYSENLYLDSEFDITPYLKNGKNRIALLCFKYSSSSWLLDQDFFRFSGIFRDVTLFRLPKHHLYDLWIKSDVSLESLSAKLMLSLTGPLENTKKELVVFSPDGTIVYQDCFKGEKQEFSLSSITLWNAENPKCYSLVLKIYDGNQIVEVIRDHFGLRKVQIENGMILFNGKRLVLKGVDRHEWNPYRGRNITMDDLAFDADFLKGMNVNAIRTSHYPNRSEFYDMADEKGFYVMDEACLESHGTILCYRGWVEGDSMIPGSHMEWENICVQKVVRMYMRDKNHPSIFMYSLGNESGMGEVFRKMREALLHLDPKLLIHYEGYRLEEKWSFLSDVTSTMYCKPKDIPSVLDRYPMKPYLQCEYAHAMGNSCGNLEEYHDLVRKYPSYQGGFIWDYIDQGPYFDGKEITEDLHYGGDYLDKPNDHDFCCNGIIFADRRKAYSSSKALAVRHLYQPFFITKCNEGIQIENELTFLSGRYQVKISSLENGKYHLLFSESMVIKPLEKIVIPCKEKNITLIVEIYLLEDALGRKKEELISYQDFLAPYHALPHRQESYPIVVTQGKFNLGVKCHDLSLLFSLANLSFAPGGLISLKVKEDEYLSFTALPTIFRALTNNDLTNDYLSKAGLSLSYSKYLKGNDVKIEEHLPDSFKVTYHYAMDENGKGMSVSYLIRSDGTLEVQVDYEPLYGLKTLGEVALHLSLPKSVSSLEYRGREMESYPDRKDGNYFGFYRITVKDGYTDYIYPQENGNHEDTESLLLHNDHTSLLFTPVDERFSFHFQENSAFEIDNARHHNELPKSHENHLEIIGLMRGVGGDDSWGACVHPPYEIDARIPHQFRFVISCVKGEQEE